MIRSLLLACVLAAPLSGASAYLAPRTHVVQIDRMKFGAMPKTVRVGDTIVWVNADMVRHSATARDGGFDVDLPPGAKAATRIRSAGAVTVICKFHPGMKARLSVGR